MQEQVALHRIEKILGLMLRVNEAIVRRLEQINMAQKALTDEVTLIGTDLSTIVQLQGKALASLQDQIQILKDGGDPDQSEIDAAVQSLQSVHDGMQQLASKLSQVQVPTLTVTPNPGSCAPGGSIQFSVGGGIAVDWSVDPNQQGGSGGASIEPNGMYTAGPNAGVDTITATAQDESKAIGTATANVVAS
jgi:hypothetical protein